MICGGRGAAPAGLLAGLLLIAAAFAVSAQTRDWPSERPPRPLAAKDIKFPSYDVHSLPNGLQVVVVQHHEQPIVSMRLLVRTGSAADPKGKAGLTRLMASLLDQGTTSKTAQQLNEEIDFIGGAMGAGAGSDLTFINTLVMKDSFELGMRTLSDMARNPAFAQEEIERQRQQVVSSLKVSLEDPEWVANSVFDRLVYGVHPYGTPDSGTPESLAGITRDDLLAFHTKYFAPNNTIVALVGDVNSDEAFAMAEKVFGDWSRKDVPLEKFTPPPDSTRRVIVIDKPDSVQTEVRVGHIGIPRKHDDYMALNLAIRILGGEGSNRLHQVLRTERALTYGAQARFDTLKDTGDIRAETNTRSEATGEVLRLIVDEFWRLQRERVGERELADAKAYLTGSFPLTIETPDAIATQVLNVLFYGLPLQQLQNFRERVNAVTVDDIQRVARYYLRPDRLSIVLVGNAAAFTPQLRNIGFGRYETIPIDNLDLMTADFKRASSGGAPGTGRPGAAPR
jgi:zinc protease